MPALTHDLLTALLPGRCPGCGVRAEPVCESCARAMRRPASAPPPPGVGAWTAPFAYSGVARELVARVKYRNRRSAVPFLAAAVVDEVVASPALDHRRIDVVTWAPTTTQRRRERGFDHAALLARAVAHALGLPARSLLVREPGPPQTGRPSRERLEGPAMRPRRMAGGARVLVVDDIATTGATIAAAARALRSRGALTVVAATVARTPAPGSD